MPSQAPVTRGFQVFVKPAGAACNLACRYCYYLDKTEPKIGDRPVTGPGLSRCSFSEPARTPADLLEDYIAQHIAASADEIIRFSWHGGEPTILGVDYFRKAVDIQRRLCPPGRTIANGMQTNGTLLDDEWGRFLAAEGFAVGLSIDGPRAIHNRYRVRRNGSSAFEETMRGYEILRRHAVPVDILCVVGAHNVRRPSEVYGFFKEIGASYVSFLPLVERRPGEAAGVSPESVPAEAWGDFLSAVFDDWLAGDIGRIKVQVIEEAARTAFGQEHSLCLFRPVCGDIPVLERNGDVFSCDHFVDEDHRLGNIRETPLAALIESRAQRSFGRAKLESLPRACRACEVLDMCNGECPKNRFALAPDGEPGLNYLCPGYRKFFNRVRPFVAEVAAAWRRQNAKC
ncbi:MAG: anaerobic sulfatase maturase [Candidatus Aminicenantes bacterium RBG_16_63_16]|nr:MAG: anaerobic sulfatase maturase [Candidatus Aminicenantes bacterium RBG_16_63_16]